MSGQRLQALVEGVVAAAGLELVQMEVQPGLLRVMVDQPGGVGLSDCERASRSLSDGLDAELEAGEDLLAGPYTLEVCSPGADRPLVKREDFIRFTGQRARVRTRTPVEGSRNLTGKLEGAGEEGVQLRQEPAAAALTIAWENVAQARLAPQWSKPQRKRGRS